MFDHLAEKSKKGSISNLSTKAGGAAARPRLPARGRGARPRRGALEPRGEGAPRRAARHRQVLREGGARGPTLPKLIPIVLLNSV